MEGFLYYNILVRMYATEDRDIRFNQLHDICHTPSSMRRYAPPASDLWTAVKSCAVIA